MKPTEQQGIAEGGEGVPNLRARRFLTASLISRACVQWLGTWLVLFVPWILLVLHLSSFWSVDPQYSYGYVVPFIAAFFFWEKWKTPPSGSALSGKLLSLMGASMAAVLLALAWLAHEAVPDWSVLNWSFALSVVLSVLSLIAYWRGRPAALHLLFPVLFTAGCDRHSVYFLAQTPVRRRRVGCLFFRFRLFHGGLAADPGINRYLYFSAFFSL